MSDNHAEQDVRALIGDDAVKIRQLTDLSRAQQSQLRAIWSSLAREQRQRIVTEMIELAELSVELDFTRALQVALDDDDDAVRAAAIDGLWEDESPSLLRRLLDVLARDPAPLVREAALRSLARFALLAVHGKLGDDAGATIYRALMAEVDHGGESVEARRRAIEALAVFPDDEVVQELIASAYADRRLLMRASALYAMGRNLDPGWVEPVLRELTSDQPMLRFEAARASGELGDQRAVPLLIDLLADPDREAQLAAVAALGKLGGRTAGTALRKLLDTDDDALRDAAEEALDELNFGANPLTI